MHNIPLILRSLLILIPCLYITARLRNGMTEQASTKQYQELQTGSILHSRYRRERFWPAAVRLALLSNATSVAMKQDPAHSSGGMGAMNVRMPAPPLFNVHSGATGKDRLQMFRNVSMSLGGHSNDSAENNDSSPADPAPLPGVVYPSGTEFDSKQMKHLGKGKFGDVWEATDLETGERVVVKFFYDENTNEYLTWNKADEANKWFMLKHIEECKVIKEVVSTGNRMYPSGARGICECNAEHVSQGLTNRDSAMYTVWEMVGNDDLTTIQMPTNIQDRIQIARSITKQVAEVLALLSMFHPPIIHHDLKGENVVVSGSFDEGFDVKIIDFGCFIPASEDMKNSLSIGDPKYMPPEHTPFRAFADPPSSFDMYALGLIHMALVCPELTRKEWYPNDLEDGARPVLKVEDITKAIQRQRRITGEDLTFTAEDLTLIAEDLSLIETCLHATPELRPTPMEVVQQLSNGVNKKTLVNEKVIFKEGDAVEMFVNTKWVECVVSKAAEETYDIVMMDEVCNKEGDGCVVEKFYFSDVDPARVKAVGKNPSIDVPDVRPGSNLPGMERDPVEEDDWDQIMFGVGEEDDREEDDWYW